MLQSHTHCQAAQSHRTSQSLSISVSFPTHGRKKIKHHCTILAIRNAEVSAKLKVKTFNKRIGKQTVQYLEIPHHT